VGHYRPLLTVGKFKHYGRLAPALQPQSYYPEIIGNGYQIRRKEMRRNIFLSSLSLALLFGSALTSSAQVKRVQMHIAGYLCGN